MDDFAAELGIDFKTSSLKDAESDSLKLQKAMEGVEAAASGLESGINSANKAAGDLTGKTGALDAAMESLGMGAKDAGSSVKALGDDTESTARKQTAFLASLKAQADTLGKSKSDILAYKAAQLGLGAQAAGDIGKIKAFEGGLRTVATTAKLTSSELLNVGYQLQDFGVQIASGQSFLTAGIQQGSQLSNVFATAGLRGIGFGGVIKGIAASMGSLLVAALPVIVAVGALAAGFALFNREVTKGVPDDLTKSLDLTEKQLDRIKAAGIDTSVTMGDTFKATFLVLGDYAVSAGDKILKAWGTSWDGITKVVGAALDWIGDAFVNITATQVGLFTGAFSAIKAIFSNLPSVLGDAFVSAFNIAGKAVTDFLNQQIINTNELIRTLSYVNPALAGIQMPTIDFKPIANEYKGAMNFVGQAAAAGFKDGFDTTKTMLSGFVEDVRAKAIKLREDILKTAAGKGAGKDSDGGGRKLAVFDSADTAKAIMTFDNAFNKGLFDAMQRGKKIVDTAIKQINAKLADIGSMKILNSNVNSGSSLQSFNDWSDYAQAYKDALTNLKEGELLSQQVVYDAYLELQARRKINEEYDKTLKMGERIKALDQKTATDGAVDSLTSASDQFWDTFLIKGRGSITDLGASLKDIFFKQASDGLKAGFEPVLQALRTSLKGVFDNLFSSAKDGMTSLLQKAKILTKGADGTYSFDATSKAGQIAGQVSQAFIIAQIAKPIQDAVSNALGIQAENAWGKFGSNFGIVGTLIGNLLGGGKTDARAAAELSSSGSIVGAVQGGKRTDETTSALGNVISALSSGYDAIKSLGGTLTTYVKNLHIGQRDNSEATLSNGKIINAGSVGDSADLANDALMAVLKASNLGSAALNKIKDGLIASGAGFDDITSTLSSVKGALDSVTPALSDWQTKLKSITDTFTPLIAQTGSYSTALKDAFNTAKAALVTGFNDDIKDQLLKAQSTVAGQYSDMLKLQAGRISDATALGANLNDVLALNAQETQNFIDSLSSSYSTISDLTDAYTQLKAQMAAAGKDTGALDTAFGTAKDKMKSSFNESTSDALLQASNETLYNLEQMLKTQKDRIADARALGANIAAVDRLNAVETSNFFKNLSATEKLQLGDYLGLIEDYTGKIGVVGSKLLDALDPLISGIDDTINTLKDTSANLRSLAKSIGDTSQSIKEQYANVTPLASINSLRDQFKSTAASAIGGDQDALAKLSDMANTLIQRSRTNYGSTAQFGSDYNLVTSLLDQAQAAASGGADVADAQITALNSQIDLLTEIKNILGDSDPQLETLANDLGQLSGSFGDVKTLLGQYLALTAAQAGATLSDTQLQSLATLVSSSVANTQATTQAVSYAAATTSAAQAANTVSPASGSQAATDATMAALTGYFQALQKQLADQQATNVTLQQQNLTLQRQIAQNTAKAVG